jgi:hypothetical protein
VSVIMTLRVPADTAKFEQYAASHKDLMKSIAADGKAAGAIHHLFALGEGEVVVVDEWPDEKSFQKFFTTQKDIPGMMRDAGATGEPQISFARKLDSPDQF